MKKTLDRKNTVISCPKIFDLGLCLDCGQAFRWEKDENTWRGVIGDKYFCLEQQGDRLIVSGCADAESIGLLREYLDFDRDYEKITEKLKNDSYFKKAFGEYPGIRILRQSPWEALCSFIISQNNNIPRIKGIISRLCENFGEEITESVYSFPSAEKLALLTVEELSVLRSGFRAKYIIDAAKKVASNEINLERIREMPIEDARNSLMTIKGVGPKVAECALLYGFYRLEAFPVDVWVKRILAEMYPDGLPECFSGYEGIAQQYLFHWRRNLDKKG